MDAAISGYKPPSSLIAHLSEVCGLRRTRPVEQRSGLEIHYLDLTSLRINASFYTPFLLSPAMSGHENISGAQLKAIEDAVLDVATSLKQDWFALVLGGTLRHDAQSIADVFASFPVAVIDRSVAETIYAAESPLSKTRALISGLAARLGRSTLAPYVVGDPAFGSRFFGRADLVKRMVQSHNYTIMGNRRIGKTSLLREVKHRLGSRYKKIRFLDIYGSRCNNTSEVLTSIILKLFDRQADAEKKLADPHLSITFPILLRTIAQSEDCKIALFIDEMDRILEFDKRQDYQLTHLLRETFQQGDSDLRIFVAGFRRVMQARSSGDSPLFNFTTPMYLPRFTLVETKDMVEAPLLDLGIDLRRTDISSVIYAETAGHPELIQICCSTLIDMIEAEGHIPKVSDLMQVVVSGDTFRERVWMAFLANTNAFEELVCYLLIQDAIARGVQVDTAVFTLADADRMLTQADVRLPTNHLTALIDNMQKGGILCPPTDGSMKVKVAVPQLGRYLCNLDINMCVARARDQCRELGTEGLWSEADHDTTSR